MPQQRDFPGALKLFYSYSHRDEAFRLELGKAIALLRRQGLVEDWHDRKIGAGAVWADEIDSHLASANIVVLLISADFIDSEYCFGKEMRQALEQHVAKVSEVIPIIIRDTDLTNAPFSHLQYLPKDGVPVNKWENRDSAYKEIAIGLRTTVDRIKHRLAAEIQGESPSLAIRENRKLDAAIARVIPLHQAREVALQIHVGDSEGLVVAIERDLEGGETSRSYSCLPSDVRSSEEFSLPWLQNDLQIGDIELCLRLDAPGLAIANLEKRIRVQPFRDSGIFTFQVIADTEGQYHLTAQLLCRDLSLAERILKTRASQHQGPNSGGGASETVIASVSLETRAKAMSAASGASSA